MITYYVIFDCRLLYVFIEFGIQYYGITIPTYTHYLYVYGYLSPLQLSEGEKHITRIDIAARTFLKHLPCSN